MHNKKFTVVIKYEDNPESVKKAQKSGKYRCVGSDKAEEGVVMNNVTVYKNKELPFECSVMLAGMLKAAAHDILSELLKREMLLDGGIETAGKFFSNIGENVAEIMAAKAAFEHIYDISMQGKLLTFIVDRESVDGSER